MKLLITLDFPPETGGIQQYLFYQVRFTYAVGDRIIVGCKEKPPKLQTLPLKQTVSYTSTFLSRINKKFSLLSMFYPYYKVCRTYSNNCTVECGNIYAALVAWILFPVTKQPYRIYTYGTEIIAMKRKNLKAYVLKKVFKAATEIMTISTYTYGLITTCLYHNRISLITPKIQFFGDRSTPPSTHQSSSPRNIIVSVGRLVPHKGHHILIAASHILANVIDFKVIIIGSGPEEKKLYQLRKMYSLESKVQFITQCSDQQLCEIYTSADVFVFPSLERVDGTEGFGIALLEAMSYGIPIVAHAIGGIPEILDFGECGMLIPPQQPYVLAHAINKLLTDQNKRHTLTTNAFNRLITYYVW